MTDILLGVESKAAAAKIPLKIMSPGVCSALLIISGEDAEGQEVDVPNVLFFWK